MRGGAVILDPKAYGAAVARNSCRNFWRGQNPGWADLKGRLSRFFRYQPNWASWEMADQLGKVCGPANWQDQAMAAGNRVAALLDRLRRIESSALPRSEIVAQLDATDWDRLLRGFFDFLKGPVRMDDLVSIAGVLFGVRGSRQMSFDEAGGADDEDGRAFDPPEFKPLVEQTLAMQQVMEILWAEIKSMPKRWLVPFLLNPPVAKGSAGKRVRDRNPSGEEAKAPDRGEVALFVNNGVATIAEIAALVGLNADQYATLWRELQMEQQGEPPLEAVPDARLRFAMIWPRLPLEDDVIARVMGLASGQKVINLRMVAKNHLAKALTSKNIGPGG
jgi:hypothetical protein